MATHQDIVDYCHLVALNGNRNDNVKSLAALTLFRFIRNLLRYMQWPEGTGNGVAFGEFTGGTDSNVAVTFTIGKLQFAVTFYIDSIATKADVASATSTSEKSYRLTIEKSLELLYEPSEPQTLDALYERASAEILGKARLAL